MRPPALFYALALTLLVGVGVPASARTGEALRLVSYNVHGLPSLVARDAPTRRIPIIADRIARYDLALLQEDFVNGDPFEKLATRGAYVRSNRATFRPAYLLAVPLLPVLLGPVLVCGALEDCSVVQGAGLTTLVPGGGRATLEPLPRLRFGDCSGYLGAANDCLAAKGLLGVRVRLGGLAVDVYNTHLDAGRGDHDRAARAAQMREIVGFVDVHSSGRAVVLAGDLNSAREDAADRDVLATLIDGLGLADSGAQGDPARWKSHLDYVLFRSGAEVRIRVEHAAEADFRWRPEDGPPQPLSDHPALEVELVLSPAGAE